MKRILVSLIFSVLLLLPVGAQERAVREAAPQDLVKSLEMPLFWENDRTLVLYSGTMQKPSYVQEDIFTGERKQREQPQRRQAGLSDQELDEHAKNPTLSPDGTQVAFTLNNDLYSKELATGKLIRHTYDGSPTVLNGWASWVYYEEILGRGSMYRSFWWSPDSRRLVFFRSDDTHVPMFPIYVADGQDGYLEETRYPKAGEANPTIQIGIVTVEEGSPIVWADFDPAADQYFGQPFWTPDGKTLLLQWMNRTQNRLKLYAVDPETGKGDVIYTEEQETWLGWIETPHFTKTGFLMVRDFEKWQHIYLYAYKEKTTTRLTDGPNWGIIVHGTDPEENYVYYSARREMSTRSNVYRVPLKQQNNRKGSVVQQLTPGDLHYTNVQFSPGFTHFTALASNVSTPSRSVLFGVKEGLMRVLDDAKGPAYDTELAAGNVPVSEMHFLTTEDGFTIPAIITWPLHREEGKKYPVLVNVYGGPNNGSVMDRWVAPAGKYHWAKKGVIQVTLDHRGSGHCGKRGLDMMYRKLGTWEIHDYKLWIDYLRNTGSVDEKRVGITGYSYGGYVTALAVCTAGDYFPYGIAGAGVFDWMFYDTHYTERFMDTPQNNPEGYKNASVLEHCSTYGTFGPSALLITHGTSDDNVHFQNAMRLADELMKHNKLFQFMLYPGARHGYRGYQGAYSATEETAFWTRYLLEE
jgi:dipeptidyl-peptidase-4